MIQNRPTGKHWKRPTLNIGKPKIEEVEKKIMIALFKPSHNVGVDEENMSLLELTPKKLTTN